jgi:hypothetical protein
MAAELPWPPLELAEPTRQQRRGNTHTPLGYQPFADWTHGRPFLAGYAPSHVNLSPGFSLLFAHPDSATKNCT